MQPLDLALRYMDLFYSGRDPEELRPLFAPDLIFEGPFFHFDSAEAYIDVLKRDPPEAMRYHLLHVYQADTSVCLIYQFFKAEIQTPMAQVFEVGGGRIRRIRLIFDTGAFQ